MSERTFLFITANHNEYYAFKAKNRFIQKREEDIGKGIVCQWGNFGNYHKVCYHDLSSQGEDSERIISYIVDSIKPDAVILIGIACGNKFKRGGDKQKIGDVLIAKRIIDRNYKISSDGRIQNRGGIYTCSTELYNKFHYYHRKYMETHKKISIYCGEIITDSPKIDHSETIQEIFNERDNYPIGYEMEGYCAVRACDYENMVFLVKGVSDFGDGEETEAGKEKDQKKAAKNAVDFCHYVFSQGGLDDIPQRFHTPSIKIENNLPFRQNKYFSGREKEIKDLKNLFDKNREINAVNICQKIEGLGGVGKTALAVEYAYRYSKNFEHIIWFLVAENSTTLYNDFVEFANRLKIVLPPEFKPEELQFAIKNWLSEHKGWLLIFDNLETDDTIIQPYLPTNINGHFIVTTRNTHINIGERLELGVFSLDEAIDFLRKRFSVNDEFKYEFTDFTEKASELAKRLGFLPLALEQAAAYIWTVRKTITDYLKLLDNVGLEPFKNEKGYFTPTNYKSVVTATWKVSFDKLREEERQLFNLCAYMAPNKIPLSFFVEMRHKLPEELNGLKKALEKDGGAELANELRHYSLAGGNAYYMDIHKLVQEVVRESHYEVSNDK